MTTVVAVIVAEVVTVGGITAQIVGTVVAVEALTVVRIVVKTVRGIVAETRLVIGVIANEVILLEKVVRHSPVQVTCFSARVTDNSGEAPGNLCL
jgi:ribosomal protein L2